MAQNTFNAYDAQLELQKKEYNDLKGGSVTDIDGNNVTIYEHVPQGTDAPYVKIGQANLRRWSTKDAEGADIVTTTHAFSRTASYEEVKSMLHEIASTLTDSQFDLSAVNHNLIMQHIVDSQPDIVEEKVENSDVMLKHGVFRMFYKVIDSS